jgi:antitoxin (DNA-binding transcriptional repressor) of toxin-antitoxin stability system
MKCTVQHAEKNLEKLIEKACRGEDVIITLAKKPIVKLVAIAPALRERVPGGFEGQFSWTQDAFDPLTEEEMRELGFEF